jgi:exodeoxyribonuclease V beta subunit
MPEILDRVPPRCGVIQASAGTGKTYTLERLVVDLILKGTKLEEILVVTFTEKATLEINARVRRMLDTLVGLEATPPDTGASAWELTPDDQKLLNAALRSFDRATLSTIHGFCRQVLQDSAFESASLFHQELADGQTLFRQAFRDLLRTDFSRQPMSGFLQEAVSNGWSVEDVEELLWSVHQQEGRLEPEVAGLEAFLHAFPAHLLGQESALIQSISELPGKALHSRTRQAAVDRVLGFLELMGQTPSPITFLEAWDFDSLVKACAAITEGPASELDGWFKRMPAPRPTPEALLTQTLLNPVRARLRALKAEAGLYDFQDMVLRVRDALVDGPRGEALARRLAGRFKVAIIDEFQDTDSAQWEIFRRVFLDQGRQIYVIGDPKQAIYGFRGGDLPTYYLAKDQLIGASEPLELAENHRSTSDVIQAYNHLFTHADPAFFNRGNRYDVPVGCGNKQLAFQGGSGAPLSPVQVIRIDREPSAPVRKAVAHTLALEIRDLITGGAYLGSIEDLADSGKRPKARLSYRHVQVLAAKRTEALLMADALREVGIPYAFYKQEGLFQSDEARDLLDVLRALEDPRDAGRLARALVTPFFGYAPPDLEGLPGLSEDHPVRARLEGWQELARARAFPQLLDRMLGESGLAVRLRMAFQGDRALTNHLHLAELLAEAARERTRDLPDLIRLLGQWVDGTALPPGEQGNLQRLEAEPEAVQILTMHQSKGLEAPVVALFGFTGPNPKIKVHRFHVGDERRLWLGSKKGPREDDIKAEEDGEAERLMYVALTRAKTRLLLPCIIADTAKGEPIHPKGVTRALNPVLRAVVERGEVSHLFEVVGLRRDPNAVQVPEPLPDLSGVRLPAVPEPSHPDYAAARKQARPTLTTSYTHLSAWVKAHAAEAQDLVRHQEQDQPGAPIPAGDVPGGPRAGQAMHALLEEMDLDAAGDADFDTWWTPARQGWTTQVLARFGLDRMYAEPAARRAFQAVHVPLPSRRGTAAPLLVHDAGRLAREMDFLSTFFETPDFATGAMDAVFQRDGLTYVLDWKNDLLASYAPGSLATHIAHRYTVQVKLYTWVILRWLRIETEAEYDAQFGGLHYVFLRGLPGEGVWFHRPSWEEVQGWKADLLDLHGEVSHG